MFYYDVLKDILLISLLNQVEITLLEDVGETTEYDFGGLMRSKIKVHPKRFSYHNSHVCSDNNRKPQVSERYE